VRHSKDSTDRLFDYDLHLETRTLWVGSQWSNAEDEGGTDAIMAEKLVKGLHLLSTGAKAEEPIIIKMNNLGGFWHHGMAMYDAIRACKASVTIEAMGYCMSMGSVILQAADRRVLHPNCRFMIHDGGDGYSGHARNFEAWGRESTKIRREMYRIYAERSGKPVGYWAKRCVVDWMMSAEEALREGLADEVLQSVKQFNKTVVKKPRKRKKS
jgi:ATP-dependent Clp endopeptidase proteolytic subunit ClpP